MKDDGKKRFNFIIGNPPYQEEAAQKPSESNGQTRKRSVFHLYQNAVEQICDKCVLLIYPGGRWIHRSGKGMEDFGIRQINDPHLKKVVFYPNANELFPDVGIADGISIVLKDMKKSTSEFAYEYVKNNKKVSKVILSPGEKLIPLNPINSIILDKIDKFVKINNLSFLHDIILSQKLFGIESDFIEKNKNVATPLERTSSIDFTKKIKILTNDKAGKGGRAKWFVINRDLITVNKKYISEWQVVVSSANAGGQKRDRQLEIIDNNSAFGRVRVALASFKTESEAKNFYKYVESKIIQFLFLMTDEALTSLGKYVPNLNDYSNKNKFINFDMNIDEQLKDILELSQDDIGYIIDTVDNFRKKSPISI